MTRFGKIFFTMALWVLAGQWALRSETTNSAPDFKEVYELIRAHAPGMTDAELNRAAVQGLIEALGSKVSLISNGGQTNDSAQTTLVSKINVFDGNIAYLRIVHVEDGLAPAVRNAYQQINATNKLKGLVIDLRYADGGDYAAAAATADLFITKARPLLDWGNGVVSSHEKTDAIPFPVAVLVNRATAGSAEALAAILRQTDVALILGTRTAGEAMVSKDFPLKDGEHLRIAASPVILGDGSTISPEGIKPDIDVSISLEDERAYYADAFWVLPKTNLPANGSTNQTRRPFNEAELVREHREGLDRQTNAPTLAGEAQPDKPIISDPALARALDLLKGLAVMRQSHS